MSSSTTIGTPDQIKQAISQSGISTSAGNFMTEELDDIAVAGAGGIDIEELDSEENTLVSVIIDASSSMLDHKQDVINAYNDKFLAPLRGAKNAGSILVSAWVFSDDGGGGHSEKCRLLHDFKPVNDGSDLDDNNYHPYGMTPLYECVKNALTGLFAYGETLKQAGSRVKHIMVVFSDGQENASAHGITSAKLKDLSADLLSKETFVLSYVYFGSADEGDAFAEEIGFPAHHRVSVDKNDSEIRRIFGEVSASVISTSQTLVSTNLGSNDFFMVR